MMNGFIVFVLFCWNDMINGRPSRSKDGSSSEMISPLEKFSKQDGTENDGLDPSAKKKRGDRFGHRLEKYDRLLEMAERANVDVPNLRQDVEALREREQALIQSDESQPKPPVPPRLDGAQEENLEYDQDEDPGERMHHPRAGKREMDETRREAVKKNKERMEMLRNMNPEERIAEIRKERENLIRNHENDISRLQKKQKVKPPPRDLVDGIADLPPPERKQKLKEHHERMKEHRDKMDLWRQEHQDYLTERRAIMDDYRELAQQVREAVFANRPL
uniref:Uncharacterized protein n=1 Tax=Aureoumbra lagunensis TaxID=44058 RepID=A0A7S3K227_9STRA|mmetsp:Transcript_13976/g.17426  ORF Transcript_13976/g.17426 Transcript_13976/m.17426 type:complete len:276 (-) Transcript_13976:14-841(-)